jgi:RNA polymerase sigma-70 factor (ECF subfamily)
MGALPYLYRVFQLLFPRRRNPAGLTDEALIDAYKQSGDTALVGELYKRYAHLVYGVGLKYMKDPEEAQDIAMMVFEKLMADLKQHQVQQFKPWLYMVARNQCLMVLRKRKGHETVELPEYNLENDEDGGVETGVVAHLDDDSDIRETQLNLLEEGIKTLNEEQKVCVELFYLQDKSYVEVAEITGYELKQVKSYIQNGKRNLKIFLTKHNG